MPRISAEARSAGAYRAGGKPPAPPRDISPEAAKVWREIANGKPVGWFDAGSLVLLRQYCETTVEARRFAALLAGEFDSLDDRIEVGKHIVRLNGNLTTMATKLRLSVQAAVDRRNRILDEDGAGAKAGDKLLGGKAVWGGKLRAVK